MRRLATLVVAALAIPALASAQRTESRGRHVRTSGGEVALRMGLDHSQVQQLQQALRDDGCNPGSIDGVLGPRTRQAMACSRRKHDLTGQNANDLLRALNLPFTAADSMGTGGMMRSRGRMRDTTGMSDRMRDTTGRMHGTMHGNMHGTMHGSMHGSMRGRSGTRPDTTH